MQAGLYYAAAIALAVIVWKYCDIRNGGGMQ